MFSLSQASAGSAAALPRISVVTPSFNQAKFLERTMRSVLDQQYRDLEYLVIDGGSTDGSLDIIRRHADRLTYWVSEPDRGQSHAINKGFARATGEVLTWLNSDDCLYPGSLAFVGEIFRAFPQICWVTGATTIIDETDRIGHVGLYQGRFRSLIKAGWYNDHLLPLIQQEGTFWRRSLWDRAGGQVDETRHLALDYKLWNQFADFADLVSVQSILGMFRSHPAQKTAQLQAYFREAGLYQADWLKTLLRPCQIVFNRLSWMVAPRIVRIWRRKDWYFQPGPFFRGGLRETPSTSPRRGPI